MINHTKAVWELFLHVKPAHPLHRPQLAQPQQFRHNKKKGKTKNNLRANPIYAKTLNILRKENIGWEYQFQSYRNGLLGFCDILPCRKSQRKEKKCSLTSITLICCHLNNISEAFYSLKQTLKLISKEVFSGDGKFKTSLETTKIHDNKNSTAQTFRFAIKKTLFPWVFAEDKLISWKMCAQVFLPDT